MPRRQRQKFAAFALVRSERSDLHDGPLPGVIDDAVHAFWRIDHHRTVALQIGEDRPEDCRVVSGEDLGTGVVSSSIIRSWRASAGCIAT
jgi:hypothetical protein